MPLTRSCGTLLAAALLAGCSGPEPSGEAPGLNAAAKPASEHTRAVHQAALRSLPFADKQDFALASRGRIAGPADLVITNDTGGIAWDMTNYRFIEQGTSTAPDTVHPSLWRQARLNQIHGLFEVVDGIWQVRGYDLSNITFIRGARGWIVVDPLISAEPARAALDLVNATLGERPVTAVIYSHSHVDHFGGIEGVASAEAVASGAVQIIAPKGFMHHAVSENVVAGNAMTRRATYMFGRVIEPGPQGRVDTGLGRTTSAGAVGLLPPTTIVGSTPTELTIDGVRFVFQYTPGAEAPAELMFHLPDLNAFCAAEMANGVLHNLYTLRGAQVRSGALWAKWLDEALTLFGDDMDVVFGSHHWPRWGRAAATEYLGNQRDLYKYIHDQTLRLANLGHTPGEIAELLDVPDSIGLPWYNRGYYGTVKHNARAQYQLYLGWYDGHPASLDPLPPAEAGAHYVAFMGGPEVLLQKAQRAFDDGQYRFVAEVLRHLVFAAPDHRQARLLQADALEQLGYQAESGPWRNVYLSAAQELRHGVGPIGIPDLAGSGIGQALTPAMLFDFLAVRLDGPAAADEHLRLDIRFTDRQEDWQVEVHNGVLHARPGPGHPDANVSLALGYRAFMGLLAGKVSMVDLLARDQATLDGNPLALRTFAGLFVAFPPDFGIVAP